MKKNILLSTMAFFIVALLLLAGCKKESNGPAMTPLQQLFEDNILNQNFIVDTAIDNGINHTSEYYRYYFILTRDTSWYQGPLKATKGTAVFTGTWKSNDDYSKLEISLTSPSIPTEFVFLNRPWKFTRKAFPVMELAPWFGDPKILFMKRL